MLSSLFGLTLVAQANPLAPSASCTMQFCHIHICIGSSCRRTAMRVCVCLCCVFDKPPRCSTVTLLGHTLFSLFLTHSDRQTPASKSDHWKHATNARSSLVTGGQLLFYLQAKDAHFFAIPVLGQLWTHMHFSPHFIITICQRFSLLLTQLYTLVTSGKSPGKSELPLTRKIISATWVQFALKSATTSFVYLAHSACIVIGAASVQANIAQMSSPLV